MALGPLRLLLAVAATTASLLTLAPAAEASFFFGRTARGGDVDLVTGRKGAPRLVVSWTARCPGADHPVRGTSTLYDPDAASSPNRFAMTVRERVDNIDTTARATGRRDRRGPPGSERYTGSFSVSLGTIGGKPCKVRRMRWRAWQESHGHGRWEMRGDPADYMSGGATYRYDRRGATIARGDRRGVDLEVSEGGHHWTAAFSVAPDHRLRAGRRYVDPPGEPDDPGREGAASLDVAGDNRACRQADGTFEVLEARFDRRGRMRDITIAFEQHCEGSAAAFRGTITWRSR